MSTYVDWAMHAVAFLRALNDRISKAYAGHHAVFTLTREQDDKLKWLIEQWEIDPPPEPVTDDTVIPMSNARAREIAREYYVNVVVKLKDLLNEYHSLATQIDATATAQEGRAQHMTELAALARSGNPEEAQRLLGQFHRQPQVWDFGNAVAELRRLKKKSEKLLK